MALPLLALGSLALAAPAYKWMEKMKSDIKRDADKLTRQDQGAEMLKMQEGLDLTTPEGQAQYQTRMMANPLTLQAGTGLWSNQLDRSERTRQWDWDNTHLSATEQANLKQRQAEAAQQASYQNSVLGQNSMQDQRMYDLQVKDFDEKKALLQYQRDNPFTPQQLQEQTGALFGKAQSAAAPFENAAASYNTASDLIGKGDATSAAAGIVALERTMNPGNQVTLDERGQVVQGGMFGDAIRFLDNLKGKGLDATAQSQLQGILDTAIQRKAEQSQREIANLRAQAQPNAQTRHPGLNEQQIFGAYTPEYFDIVGRRKAAKTKEAGAVMADALSGKPVQEPVETRPVRTIDDRDAAFSKRDKSAFSDFKRMN